MVTLDAPDIRQTRLSDFCVVIHFISGCLLLQQHGEPLQAPGVQAKAAGQEILMKSVEGAVVLGNGLNWSQPLHVDHLSAAQQEADPVFQPVCLLLQAAIDGELLKQLETERQGGSADREEHSKAQHEHCSCLTLVH